MFYDMRLFCEGGTMKTVSVREMKARWGAIEEAVRNGESFEVLNHGHPAARIIPAAPRKVARWDDHLKTAAKMRGRTGEQAVQADRDGRW